MNILESSCTFPFGTDDKEVDPDVIEKFDYGNRCDAPTFVSALRDYLDRNTPGSRE